jgi:RNA polymerase sigma factor FliA
LRAKPSAAVQTSPNRDVEALVRANLDLVPVIARQVARELGMQLSNVDDLEGEGREGLFTAAQRFDPERGVPFRRFAGHRVRGAMIDALRRESTLPRRARERLRALDSALRLNEAASEDLAAPTPPGTTTSSLDARLAEHLANLATAIATGLVAESATEGEQPSAIDPLPSPEESLARAELRTLIRSEIAALPEQERQLIDRHYFQGDRFDHVAAELGLSKSWASRLHSRAIGRLTKRLGALR